MAPPDVQGGNDQEDPSVGREDVQKNHLVGVENSHRRRRCCVLIMAVVLCLFIIGGGASVPFVLTIISQSGFNRSTQLRTTTEPTVNSSESPTVIVTSYSWSEWSPWSLCSTTPCDVEVSRRKRVCTMKKGVTKKTRADDCFIGLSSQETRKCPLTYCSDCKEIKSAVVESSNGTYLIDPDGRGPFHVYCDMTTDGGGWTVFQRRQDGSEDFNRTWDEYKTGFGNLSGEFWLGNDKIHRLTYDRHQTLRIDMFNAAYLTHYQEAHEEFNISSEREKHTFYVGNHIRGTSGSLRDHENNEMFSTTDRDNDGRWYWNGAAEIGGGWWYKDYYSGSPNGLYGTSRFGWYGSAYGRMTYCDMKVK